MNRALSGQNKRIALLLPVLLAFVILGAGCSVRGISGSPVPHTKGTNQILIRMLSVPGNIYTVNAIPEWELYGDGTLLYQPQSADPKTLLQAQLQPTEIAHIMDVVVNQDSFFADQKNSYGRGVPDVGYLLLTVNAGTQQKTVSISGGEGDPSEDQHMFAITNFLFSYHPASAHPYAAPGAVVLVLPNPEVPTHVAQWPYPDISLQQIATQECQTHYSCDPTGFFPIYGKRGADLLSLLVRQQIWDVSQGGQTYTIWAWPVLPENLVVQPDGKRWVETEGVFSGKRPLLPGAH